MRRQALRILAAVLALACVAALTAAIASAGLLIERSRAAEDLSGFGRLQAALYHQAVLHALQTGAPPPPGKAGQVVALRAHQAEEAAADLIAGGAADGRLTSTAGRALARVLRFKGYASSPSDAFAHYLSRAAALSARPASGMGAGAAAAPSAQDVQQLNLAAHAVSQAFGFLDADVARAEDRAILFIESVAIGGAGLAGSVLAAAMFLRRRRPRRDAGPVLSSADATVAIGSDNAISRPSGPLMETVGQARTSLEGAHFSALVQPSDAAALERLVDGARKELSRHEKIVVQPRDLPDRWCEIERFGNRRREDKSDQQVILRIRDITAQRRAEELLRQSSEMLRTLTDASPLAITVENMDGRVQFWNAASERVFGWPASATTGQSNPTIAPDGAESRRATCARVRAGQAFAIVEDQRIAQDGRTLDVVVSAAPLRDASGAVNGIMEVINDVTERKMLQAQLLQAQKMEGIGRLAGGIAHDFNNLLTAILGHAAVVRRRVDEQERFADEGELRTGLDQIQRAAERAAQMTQQLLAFSRNQVMQTTLMDLNIAVAEMEHMLRPLIGHDIDFQTVPAPGLPSVKADPAQITQVLVNLVLNARDAMPGGGKLTIELSTVDLDEDYGRRRMAVIPGEYVMMAVSDNGSGMDKATQARIFDPFFSTKERDKGTGLGLSTVYGIVKQTGGYIWCYSEPGVGSTFKIYLPTARVPIERRTDDRLATPAARHGSETVLLVEDEEMVRSLVKQVLSWYGYTVLEAHNADEALALAREQAGPIDLLITDLIMPGMAAVDMVRELSSERPDMQVLYMSGYTDHAVVRHQLLNGNVPFLQKPFAPDRLAHKVAEVLKGRPAATAGAGRVTLARGERAAIR